MNSSSEFLMLLKSIFVAVSVGSIVIYFILAVSYSKIFRANGEKGWKGYVPILNIWTLMKISNMNPLSIFLLIIPIVNLFVLALLSVKLANKLGRSAGFAIGLLFLPFIFYPILALSLKIETKEKEKTKKEEKKKSIFCPVCGTELKNGETKCYVCDAEIKENKEVEKDENRKDELEKESYVNKVTDEFENNEENNSEFENPLASNNFTDNFRNENNDENNNEFENTLTGSNFSNNYENESNEESNNEFENDLMDSNFSNNYENDNVNINEYAFENKTPINYNDDKVVFDDKSYMNHSYNNYSGFDKALNKNNENINKKFYHNPLDTDFDDIFLRNKNEHKKVIDVKKDEAEFNDMVSNYDFGAKELSVTDLGSINIPKKHTIKDDIEEAMEVETNYKNIYEQKPKYKSSTRTLDEILRINQNLYTKSTDSFENKVKKVEQNDNLGDDIDEEELIKRIKLLNKQMEESRNEVNEEKAKVKVCPVCGTTIPAYSKTCLLCGSSIKD